ncbi:hypothetical protein APA_4908 [Pseudanabaena sp. lw0831]|nr:hypothetical protein APA_4908 [Pseudanabaena sp. lw0831]
MTNYPQKNTIAQSSPTKTRSLNHQTSINAIAQPSTSPN